MNEALDTALGKLANAQNPSIEKILRGRGFGYEADLIKEVIDRYLDEVGWKNKSNE